MICRTLIYLYLIIPVAGLFFATFAQVPEVVVTAEDSTEKKDSSDEEKEKKKKPKGT
jgi:hypothetical protein